MAIRTQRLSDAPQQLNYEEEKGRIDQKLLEVKSALYSGDKEGLDFFISEIKNLNNLHLSLYADINLFGLLTSIKSDEISWPTLFLSTLDYFSTRLHSHPHEPDLWNMSGVLLFELGRTNDADKCFKAALKLQPDNQSASSNRRAVKQRRLEGTLKIPFSAQQQTQAKKLGQKLVNMSGRAQTDYKKPLTISLAMIVKNEEEMLPDCLASAQGLVDEMIIVDTGSTDRTKEIAEEYGAKVVHFPWNGSFADARNVSLDNAKGDWILHLDADERLIPEQHEDIRAKLHCEYLEGISLSEHNYTGDGSQGGVITHNAMRLWRNRPEYRFQGIIHEQKSQSMPLFVSTRFLNTEFQIIHFGYLKTIQEGRNKSQRNLDLLLEEAQSNPSPFNRFNIGTEYMVTRDYNQAVLHFNEAWEQLESSRSVRSSGFSSLLATRRAAAALLAGEPEKALGYAEQGLVFFPDNNDLLMNKAMAFKELGDFDSSAEQAKTALANGEASLGEGTLGNGSFLARALLGELLELQGNPLGAVQVYQTSLTEDPRYVGVLGPLTRAMLMSGEEPGRVVQEMRQYIDKQPVTAGLLVAHSLYERAATQEAKKLYAEVLGRLPEDPIARLGMVEACMSEGDLEEALDYASLEGPSSLASAALGRAAVVCSLLLGRDQQAQDLLEQASYSDVPPEEIDLFRDWLRGRAGESLETISVGSARSAVPVLEVALRLKNLEASEQLILMIQSSQLDIAERAQLLGGVFTRQGFLDSAAEEWLSWIDHSGPTAQSLIGLSYIAKAQGRAEEALTLAQDAASLDPNNHEAARMVEAFASTS